MNDLREMAANFTETAKEMLEGGADLMPVAFVIAPDRHVSAVIGLQWDSTVSKRAAYAKVREARRQVDGALILLNDCWFAKMRPGEPWPVGGIKKHPQRQEVLLVLIDGPGVREIHAYPYRREGDRVVWEPELDPGFEWKSALLGDILHEDTDVRRA